MRHVRIIIDFDVPQKKLIPNHVTKEGKEFFSDGLSIDYLEANGIRTMKQTEVQQLFNVQIPEHVKSPSHMVNSEGILCWPSGTKHIYTRGEAMKKAKMFRGIVIKDED